MKFVDFLINFNVPLVQNGIKRIIWKRILLSVIVFFCALTSSHAMEVTLEWDANTEPDLAGYRVYYKTGSSGPPYDGAGATEDGSPIDIGNDTTYTVHGLNDSITYFFVVTAYDTEGLESEYSNEVNTTSTSQQVATGTSGGGGGSDSGGCNIAGVEGNVGLSMFYLVVLFGIGWLLWRRKRGF